MFGKLNRLVQVAKTAKKASKGFKTTRRNFMKGLGSLALSSALPGGVKIATAAKKPLALKDAVPWVKTMTNELKGVVDSKKGIKLPNGSEIFYLKNVVKIIIALAHSIGAVCLIMVMSSERGI